MKFKKGDRVLRQLVIRGGGESCMTDVADQLDPGVPIVDILEELEGLWKLKVMLPMPSELRSFENGSLLVRVRELQKNREAVNKPKYTEGQAVWVRAEVGRETKNGYTVKMADRVSGCGRTLYQVHPDDIRPVEPPD